ncbi:MAG: hypothetical protein QRY72_04825 [Candidatus Rhabdochlamydia sp.]
MNPIESYSQPTPFSAFPLENALNTYTRLFLEPDLLNPSHLNTLAKMAVELSRLAKITMDETVPPLKQIAGDLDGLLKAPVLMKEAHLPISMLTAAQSYLQNPETNELVLVVQEISSHQLALQMMCTELSMLSYSLHTEA